MIGAKLTSVAKASRLRLPFYTIPYRLTLPIFSIPSPKLKAGYIRRNHAKPRPIGFDPDPKILNKKVRIGSIPPTMKVRK